MIEANLIFLHSVEMTFDFEIFLSGLLQMKLK